MQPRSRRWLSTVACATSFWAWAHGVHAGNDEAILLGSEAPMTAGAVTAIVSDGAAAWYNPAGLAKARRNTFNINASVYGFNAIAARNFIRLPDGTTGDAKVTNWILIPTALSYQRELNESWVGSLSIVVPRSSDFNLRTQLESGTGATWVLTEGDSTRENAYILGFARRLSETLRVGFTLQGVYIAGSTSSQLGAGRTDVPGAAFATNSRRLSDADYGARMGFGVQWDVNEQLRLGASVQTPTLTAYRRTTDTFIEALNPDTGDSTFYAENSTTLESVWKLSTPFRFRAGLALKLGRAMLLLDGDFASSVDPGGNDRLDRKPMGNARLATYVRLSETLGFGLGAFTDLNPRRSYGADYVGIAGGLRTDTRYPLKEDDRTLTFITTLSARYSYGWGTVPGTQFSIAPDMSSLDAKTVYSKFTAHEIAGYVGGGLNF